MRTIRRATLTIRRVIQTPTFRPTTTTAIPTLKMAMWRTSSSTIATRLVSTVSIVRPTAAATTMYPSLIPGIATGIGALATITIHPTGHSVLVCLTTIHIGAHLIMDTLGGVIIITTTRLTITATITTRPTTTTATITVILMTSTVHTPAHTSASTATMCLTPTVIVRAALAATAAALTPATLPTMEQAAVQVV